MTHFEGTVRMQTVGSGVSISLGTGEAGGGEGGRERCTRWCTPRSPLGAGPVPNTSKVPSLTDGSEASSTQDRRQWDGLYSSAALRNCPLSELCAHDIVVSSHSTRRVVVLVLVGWGLVIHTGGSCTFSRQGRGDRGV